MKVMKRHTWYLAPETAIFALCSDLVTDTVKSAMASKLLATARPEEHAVGGNMPVVLIDDERMELVEVVDDDSWLTFNVLKLEEAAAEQ